MSDTEVLVQQIIIGLSNGMIIALIAVGLVLIGLTVFLRPKR